VVAKFLLVSLSNIVVLGAAIGTAATIVVGVQKGRYYESRRDLNGRIQALLDERSKDQAALTPALFHLPQEDAGRALVPNTRSSEASPLVLHGFGSRRRN
jgi:hypothetical protein